MLQRKDAQMLLIGIGEEIHGRVYAEVLLHLSDCGMRSKH